MFVLELEPTDSENDRASCESGRYWVSFAASNEAVSIPCAFRVFVASKVQEGAPFRTLLWSASFPTDMLLWKIVDDCFEQLGYSEVFESFVLDHKCDVLLFEAKEGAERKSTSEKIQLSDDTRLHDVKFFRMDCRMREGVLGFLYKDCGLPERCELAIVLERSLSFTPDLVNWALSHHFVNELRDSHIDCMPLVEFINKGKGKDAPAMVLSP